MLSRARREAALLRSVCLSCAGADAPGTPPPARLYSRRAVVGAAAGVALAGRARPAAGQLAAPAFSYPLGIVGEPLGDGFLIRHGYACVNTIVQPEWLHTAEDWYLAGDGETGGSRVYAVAAGEVVFAGYDYPGLVVIVQHAPDLYSMYGHLDYEVAVTAGDVVGRGQFLGTVLTLVGRRVPSHLHFEIRNFLINQVVNGDLPSYGVHCGVNCPPGPGYWPIAAPEHPTALGWRNPSHVINGRAFAAGLPAGAAVVASGLIEAATELWSAPAGKPDATVIGELPTRPGNRFPLLAVTTGPEDSTATSAEGYDVWYEIAPALGMRAWVRAAAPSVHDTGLDGRPSSVALQFLLAVVAD